MIISHKHKYLFVELPRTGSSAISKELCTNYDGVQILYKHAAYNDFLKSATAQEKRYFVFSCLRNPLDDAVSLYFKYKTDHRKKFSRMKSGRIITYSSRRRFNFIQNTNADFPTYFMKFYKIPYNNWSSLSHKKFDYVIRFENLQDDFAKVLRSIGIEQKRPLLSVNKTKGRERDFLSYYTPETIARAKWVFGPFMKEWGYEFPPEWGDESVPWSSQMAFHSCNIFRSLYWKYLRLPVHRLCYFKPRGPDS